MVPNELLVVAIVDDGTMDDNTIVLDDIVLDVVILPLIAVLLEVDWLSGTVYIKLIIIITFSIHAYISYYMSLPLVYHIANYIASYAELIGW